MGKLLQEVKYIEKKGLVGIAEDGEEVSLGVPNANFLCVPVDRLFGGYYNESGGWINYLNKKEENARKEFLKECPEENYIHFFERRFTDTFGDRFFISYNNYLEKK